MKIETEKQYLTRDGHKVSIVCTDRHDETHPIIGFVTYSGESEVSRIYFTADGKYYFGGRESCLDLVAECSKWDNVAVDTPIYVSDVKEGGEWIKRHFAKYEDGRVFTFSGGKTSFTSTENTLSVSWKYAKLATEETE